MRFFLFNIQYFIFKKKYMLAEHASAVSQRSWRC